MKCPSCGAQAADDAAECPACGIIFAKWRELREKEKRAALDALDAPAPPPTNIWIVRIVAAALVALWVAVFCVYVYRHTYKLPPRASDR